MPPDLVLDAIHEGIELVITDVRSTRNFVVQAMLKEEVQRTNTSGMKISFQIYIIIILLLLHIYYIIIITYILYYYCL